jgi:hypothetical protein
MAYLHFNRKGVFKAREQEFASMTSKPVPPRSRSLFRQYNLVKAMKSAQKGGLEIGGVEITPDGTIRVLAKDAAGHVSGSDYDDWVAKRDARSA